MKKSVIIGLFDGGILNITANCLSARDTYNVIKFRKSIRKAIDDIQSDLTEFQHEAGITDPQKFDRRRNELLRMESPAPEQLDELKQMNEQFERFNAQRAILLQEEVEVYKPKLNFSSWLDLRTENRNDKQNLLNGWVEDVLEDILWTAPTE